MEQIRDTIVSLFKERDILQHIGLDDDYFDQGVSSLTVIGLQIDVEKAGCEHRNTGAYEFCDNQPMD